MGRVTREGVEALPERELLPSREAEEYLTDVRLGSRRAKNPPESSFLASTDEEKHSRRARPEPWPA